MLLNYIYRNIKPLKSQSKQQNRTSIRKSVTTGKKSDTKAMIKKDDRKVQKKDDVNKVYFIFIIEYIKNDIYKLYLIFIIFLHIV